MAISKQQLAACSTEELRKMESMIDDIIASRQDRRKKELWGNVMGAIKKYEQEIEPVTIYCRHCGDDCTIDEMEGEPGIISVS